MRRHHQCIIYRSGVYAECQCIRGWCLCGVAGLYGCGLDPARPPNAEVAVKLFCFIILAWSLSRLWRRGGGETGHGGSRRRAWIYRYLCHLASEHHRIYCLPSLPIYLYTVTFHRLCAWWVGTSRARPHNRQGITEWETMLVTRFDRFLPQYL